jgi:hypothetical protein
MSEQHKNPKNDSSRAIELTEIIVDRISKLAMLHEAGILTDKEFSEKKAELLATL